jgi:hypothetical protein
MILRQLGLMCLFTLLAWLNPLLAASPAAGTWKLIFPIQSRQGSVDVSVLIAISESDGKWFADVLDTNLDTQGIEPKIKDVVVNEDRIRFELVLGNETVGFDGRVAPKNEKVLGSLNLGGNLMTAEVYPSKLKNLKDSFEVAREDLNLIDNGGAKLLNAMSEVLRQAEKKKLKVEEVRTLTDKASKLAEPYGIRWQRFVAIRLAELLAGQETLAPIALEQARIAERMIQSDEPLSTTMVIYQDLVKVYLAAKKDDEAKKLQQQLTRMEARDYQDYVRKYPGFKPEPYTGRKAKSDRVAMFELFTNADAPNVVAAEAAFDALSQAYKPTDVVLVRYHLPGPGPDPFFNRSVLERLQYYGKVAASAPVGFLSGKIQPGGGPLGLAKIKFKSYSEAIDEVLEKPASVKLVGSGSLVGDDLKVSVEVAELQKPGEKVTLRFALLEDRIRFAGGNGIRYHNTVFRTYLGVAAGIPQTKKDGKFEQAAKVSELRKKIETEVASFRQREDVEIPELPVDLKGLKVIAFIQDDETKEVLNAVLIDLEAKKE